MELEIKYFSEFIREELKNKSNLGKLRENFQNKILVSGAQNSHIFKKKLLSTHTSLKCG